MGIPVEQPKKQKITAAVRNGPETVHGAEAAEGEREALRGAGNGAEKQVVFGRARLDLEALGKSRWGPRPPGLVPASSERSRWTRTPSSQPPLLQPACLTPPPGAYTFPVITA